ncbi:uncharacterized membrane protein YhaH (DUF805 family) [Nitrobacteraceae bacterium AZCC 2161]|jgi:uncharacterized membrane protein YhaH (DUF805 family)
MDWSTLLFSFKGRINRGKYWLAILIYMLVWVAFVAAALMWLGGLNTENLFSIAGAGLLIWLALIVLIVAGTWSGFATGIKRLHDRDKSGWWILVFWLGPSALSGIASSRADSSFVFHIAAFAVTIWGFVELGCLRGTPGPNEFGPDPLAEPNYATRI